MSDTINDYIVGHGEIWNAQIVTLYLQSENKLGSVQYMDARDVLKVNPILDGTYADVVADDSNQNLDNWFDKVSQNQPNGNGMSRATCPDVVICTGFVARNLKGQPTTLKRNGSDYTATIFGALLQSSSITIWTDVDGVYSADPRNIPEPTKPQDQSYPRKVPEAVCLQELSYKEAWELGYFGANVMHPRTTLPAMKYNIPILIKNFFNQDTPGTRISEIDLPPGKELLAHTVKGFATIDNVSLITVEGTGMVGVPGIAARIFSAMRDYNINIIMISQASSEQSICFAIANKDGQKAKIILEDRFVKGMQGDAIQKVSLLENQCVLAAVGSQMATRQGVAALLFGALAEAQVNVKTIAQGSSEYNITVLVAQEDAIKGLRAVHAVFYQSKVLMGVALIGPGLIGKTFINQLKEQQDELKSELKTDIRILAIANSKKMLLNDRGVDLDNWQASFDQKSQQTDLTQLTKHLKASYIPHSVIIDATATDQIPQHYEKWIGEGIHVITPNKKLNSGDLQRYLNLRRLCRSSFTHYFYEATVGAGLPIMNTLKHLLDTGDQVKRIEGVLSGTLSYLFNTFDGTTPWSEIVKGARNLGYTEPDPRDDLSGTDVQRKVVILARECGLEVNMDDVPVDNLVPEQLRDANPNEFLENLADYDEAMKQRVSKAKEQGKLLRFVGVVDCENKRGEVKLQEYPIGHPFTQLNGSDNIVLFSTKWYNNQPLIVRGPGAGDNVTAAGVFSDLLRLSAYFGASS